MLAILGAPKKPFLPGGRAKGHQETKHEDSSHECESCGMSSLSKPDHKGPFDELLLVQAQEEGLRLLTVDKMLVRQPLAICVEELEA